MSEIADAAIAFEGKKVSVNQNKDGVILRIAVHPHDVPRRIWTDSIGTRYQIAMVAVDDDEQPIAPEETMAANRAVRSAGMLCRNEAFQRYLLSLGYIVEEDEKEAANALRTMLGVTSRREFHENDEALSRFNEIREDFLKWRQKNPHELKTERGT